MSILIAFAALFGVLLGQFFKVFILFPASILSIIVILAASEDLDDGQGWPIQKIMISITAIEVGFVLGQTVFRGIVPLDERGGRRWLFAPRGEMLAELLARAQRCEQFSTDLAITTPSHLS